MFNNRGDRFNVTINPAWGTNPKWDGYSRDWVHALVDKITALEKADIPLEGVVAGKRGYFGASLGDEKSSLVFENIILV